MSEELKPCPFCGCATAIVSRREYNEFKKKMEESNGL